MRKIETEMNAAILNNENWASGNTSVIFDSETNESKVYLHGNHIADVGDNYLRLFDGGYQSNTTKSRLNAILAEHGAPGECVFQKNFDWFVNQEGGPIPFFSGMRLNWRFFKNCGFWEFYKISKILKTLNSQKPQFL